MLTNKEKAGIFGSDERIMAIVEYPEGFVANAYKWPAPGTRHVTTRNMEVKAQSYDRKRRHAHGPVWTAVSAKHGVLLKG